MQRHHSQPALPAGAPVIEAKPIPITTHPLKVLADTWPHGIPRQDYRTVYLLLCSLRGIPDDSGFVTGSGTPLDEAVVEAVEAPVANGNGHAPATGGRQTLKQRVSAMLRRPMTAADIAQALDVDASSIHKVLKALGVVEAGSSPSGGKLWALPT